MRLYTRRKFMATTCRQVKKVTMAIRSGLPAGIKAQDGKMYLLTGEAGHSINAEVADYAAKTVTIKGKQTVRDGFAQLQVEEIPKL